MTAVQGKAHAPVPREAARAVAITTYVLLGELVTKTDMQPLDEYTSTTGADE